MVSQRCLLFVWIFGATSAVLLLGCSGSMPSRGMRLSYGLEAQGEASGEKAVQVIERRLEALGVEGAAVSSGEGGTVAVHLPELAPMDLIKRTIAVRGELQVREVADDQTGFVPKIEGLPDGVAVMSSPVLPLESDLITYSFTAAEEAGLKQVIEQVGTDLPEGTELLVGQRPDDPESLATFLLSKSVDLDNSGLAKVSAVKDESGSFSLAVELNSSGTKQFSELTERLAKRRIGFVVDGELVHILVVREPTTSGELTIAGPRRSDRFAQEDEVRALAAALQGGALPAPVTLQSEEKFKK